LCGGKEVKARVYPPEFFLAETFCQRAIIFPPPIIDRAFPEYIDCGCSCVLEDSIFPYLKQLGSWKVGLGMAEQDRRTPHNPNVSTTPACLCPAGVCPIGYTSDTSSATPYEIRTEKVKNITKEVIEKAYFLLICI